MKFAVWGLSLALTAGLYAADEVAFSRVEVSAKLEKTPKIEYGTNNSTSYSNVKMKTQNPSWVVVVVDYTPGFLPAGKKATPKAAAKGKEGAWIDDVALDVNVEIPGEQDQVTILSGRSDIWTVQLDGRNHVAIMLIPPQILDRYLPLRGRSEQSVRLSDIKIQAVFRRKDGKELGAGYFNCNKKAEDAADYFQQIIAKSSVIKGAVLPRSKTPWFFHQFDHYDLLKIDQQ